VSNDDQILRRTLPDANAGCRDRAEEYLIMSFVNNVNACYAGATNQVTVHKEPKLM
jgi:hypothetical protein